MKSLIGTAASILLLASAPIFCGSALAQERRGAFVLMVELEIDPPQLESFKTAVTELIEVSLRVEPGAIAVYAVAVKDAPTQLRFLEIYADEKAFQAHRETPHVKRFADTTKEMIKSRKRIETDPILLRVKATSTTTEEQYDRGHAAASKISRRPTNGDQ